MIKYTQTSRKGDFMLESYLNYLEILDVCSQNNYQEIYTCKHKEENAYYLLNLVKDKEVLEGIELEELCTHIPSIKKIEETDEGILILTEYYSYKTLLEHQENENMTLSKQVDSITNLMDILLMLKTLPYSFFVLLLNHTNLVVDDKGDIKLTGLLLFSPEALSTSREDALRTIANTIHVIFTGKQILDNNVSRGIPPDMEKIINSCLNGDYFRIIDMVTDFKSSNIYRLINPEKEDIKRVTRMRKGMKRKRFNYNFKTKGILVIMLLVPIIVWGSYTLLKDKKANNVILPNNEQIDISDNVDIDDSPIDNSKDSPEEDSQIEEIINHKENMDKFFNEEFIKSLDRDNIATTDYTKYHRGEYSLKVYNDKTETSPFLVGYIDFQDGDFNFANDRTVNLSLWLSSDVDTDCIIALKLGASDKLLTQVTKKANLIANTWVLNTIEINTKNGQYIEIYINTKPNDIIWVDTMDLDILK